MFFKKIPLHLTTFLASVALHVFAFKLILSFSLQSYENKEGIEFQVRENQKQRHTLQIKAKTGSVNFANVNVEAAEKSDINSQTLADAQGLNEKKYEQDLTSLSKVPKLLYAKKISADHTDLKWARQQNIFGTVVLEILISKGGAVENVRVLQSLHPRLDQLAVHTAEEFHFTAAEIHGEPVPVKIKYRYQFVR